MADSLGVADKILVVPGGEEYETKDYSKAKEQLWKLMEALQILIAGEGTAVS